jgi:inositol-phosphate phosphatase / L-galactose 1-phosphate phosphatase / histidinol-phosphatase
MQELLSLANHLADEAGKVISRYYRTDFTIERKGDETPVTIADRTVEAELRKIIERERPDDGILGEEYGPKESRSGLTWVLDPIDGTKSFMVGRPTFGTLIALWENDTPLLGVIDQPIAKERWVGDGKTATFNGKSVKTRTCPSVKEAICGSTSPRQLSQIVSPHLNPPPLEGGMLWRTLYDECKAMVWGGDCYSYGLLANGWLDIVVESGLQPYDFAALIPIVQGAGGWMGDWEGNPLTLSSPGKTVALGNAALKDEFLSLLSS